MAVGAPTSLPAVMLALAIFGIGQGLFISPNNSAIVAAAPAALTGEAGGLLNVTRSCGISIGIAAASSLLAWRLWRIALLSSEFFGTLVAVGVLALLAIQVFENIGMTMGIMPITGIPLPFMSYGGSSTVANFAAVGLVLNVHMRRFA